MYDSLSLSLIMCSHIYLKATLASNEDDINVVSQCILSMLRSLLYLGVSSMTESLIGFRNDVLVKNNLMILMCTHDAMVVSSVSLLHAFVCVYLLSDSGPHACVCTCFRCFVLLKLHLDT